MIGLSTTEIDELKEEAEKEFARIQSGLIQARDDFLNKCEQAKNNQLLRAITHVEERLSSIEEKFKEDEED